MVATASSRKIVELASIISECTKLVDEYFTSNGLPTPSFEISGPTALHDLMMGPTAVVMDISPNDALSLHCIYSYKIATSFPVNEEATFESISEKCGLNVVDTRRMLRHAMTNSIFREPKPGVVAHTAASKLMAEDPLIFDFIGIASEERFQAAAHTVEAMKKYGFAQEPSQSGFTLGHDTNKGFYDDLRDNPSRGHRWAGAMTAFASRIPLGPLLDNFDWAELGAATIVDVGGCYGPVSIGLAKRFPGLKCVVQDFEDVVVEGAKQVPPDVSDRVTFMAYDMLTPQPLASKDVYFFRAIFHNWTDRYCVQILRNQVGALRTGAWLIINDSCLHEPGSLPLHLEKRRRSTDLTMLSYFGSRQRTVEDWRELLKEANERFELENCGVATW